MPLNSAQAAGAAHRPRSNVLLSLFSSLPIAVCYFFFLSLVVGRRRRCDYTHNLAAVGPISWPSGVRRPFVFNGRAWAQLTRWNHKVAASADWTHKFLSLKA